MEFKKSFRLLKSNPDKTSLMVLFDALFLAAIFSLYRLANYFAQSLVIPKTALSAFVFIAFSLAYYLMILLAYSFFKYGILDFIKSLFEKTKFSFKRLGQFYSLNIMIAGIFFAIILFFNFVLSSIKQSYAPFVFIIIAIPYLLLLYVVVNTSHPLFYEGSSIKESIKKSLKITFTKIKAYRESILAMILLALLLWLLFLGSGYLVRLLASKNYPLYLSLYAYFKQASIIIFDLAFYLVILINRVSFYAIVRENK